MAGPPLKKYITVETADAPAYGPFLEAEVVSIPRFMPHALSNHCKKMPPDTNHLLAAAVFTLTPLCLPLALQEHPNAELQAGQQRAKVVKSITELQMGCLPLLLSSWTGAGQTDGMLYYLLFFLGWQGDIAKFFAQGKGFKRIS